MTRRKRSSGIALSSLQEALQTQPVRKVFETVDKRSLSRGQRLLEGMAEFRPSEIASRLQISTQKYVAIRRKVEAGKIASSTLNDMLADAQHSLQQTRREIQSAPRLVREIFDAGYTDSHGRTKHRIDIWEVKKPWIDANVPFAQVEKRFASKQSAINWMGGVVGDSAKEFFVMAPSSGGGWNIWDLRTDAERNAHTGAKAVQVLLEDAEEMEDEDEA